jgi:hypothetical protein
MLGKTSVRVLAGVALWLACALPVCAQSGGLRVHVMDENGPLPGSTVTISQETGFVKTTSHLTDKSGVVEFPVLRPGGGYHLEVAFPGMATRRVGPIQVKISVVQDVTVQLAEELLERVKVTVEGNVVDLEDVSQTTKFSDEFIQDLPVQGRFYQNILPLSPGVQDANNDGNPNVHGSRSRDFKAIVGGISNVDPLTGQQGMQINPNSIEELEVITAGAGVEFSRAQGGFARIVQKQGSNELEGVFEFYYRTSKLDGEGAGDDSALEPPDFEWVQPAFQISGPILRDRLWYRLSHEWIDNELPVNTTRGIVVQNQQQGIHADQLTWQVSPRNKLALQYQSDPLTIENFGVSSIIPPDSSQTRRDDGETWSLTWTAPFSPRILVESRIAWQDMRFRIDPSTEGVVNDCVTGPSPLAQLLARAQCFDNDLSRVSGSYFRSWDDHSQRFTVGGDATIYAGRFLGARHQLKVGIVSENERYFRYLERRPDLQLFPYTVLITSQTGQIIGTEQRAEIATNVAVPQSDDVVAKGIVWGVYAEDQIKPRENLTVTVGLRLDREEIEAEGRSPVDFAAESAEFLRLTQEVGISPQNAQGIAFTSYGGINDFVRQLASALNLTVQELESALSQEAQASRNWPRTQRKDDLDIRNTNWSPFLSISWDPWSDGKTKIAATGRRYYDKIFLGIPLIELEPAVTTVTFDAVQQPNGDWIVPSVINDVNPAVNVSVVDRDLRTPYNDEFTLGFERELWAETSIGLTYINRRFRDQFQDLQINHLPGDYGRCRQRTPATPYTVEPLLPYEPDYQPGGGDGVVDDCSGKLDRLGGTALDPNNPSRVDEPDGIVDLYVQNPGWGDVLLVGNHNSIDYEAFVVALTRRQYRSWEMQASYTWSRAEGDGEDFQQELGDDRSLLEDEFGPQSYDQRHVVKLNATTITPWGFRLGTAVSWQSGLPYSIVVDNLSYDQGIPQYGSISRATQTRRRRLYANGQRNSERNTAYWNVDVRASKEFNVGSRVNMQISAEIFNLLNDDTYIIWDPVTESGLQINGANVATRRFGRRWQLGLKVAF